MVSIIIDKSYMKKDTYASLKTFPLAKKIQADLHRSALQCMVFGNFGAMNSGDEAILAGQLEELKKLRGSDITVVSRFPSEVAALHGVKSISMFSLITILKALWRTQVVIVGGGGLFCKNDRGIMGILFQLYTLYFYLITPLLLRKKVYVIGIGVYRNTDKYILALVLKILERVSLVTARDVHTYKLLHRGSIPVQLYKDNSFLMPTYPFDQLIKATFFKRRYNPKKLQIGIAVKKPGEKGISERFLQEMVTFMQRHAKKADFWLYSLDAHSSYENDEIFNKLLSSKLHNVTYHFMPTDWHPKKLFSSFGLMDFFITMRLHASIFSYRQKIPFVGISYDIKCESFLSSIGKKAYEIQDITASLLQSEFKSGVRKRAYAHS